MYCVCLWMVSILALWIVHRAHMIGNILVILDFGWILSEAKRGQILEAGCLIVIC